MAKYLIIGSSAGGIGAVEAIREVDPEGDLALLSEEPYPAYSRPAIAEYLTGEKSQEKILFRPQDFYAYHRVELVLGRKAVRLDLAQKLVHLADGEVLSWDKLLLATGGRPFLPRAEGLSLDRKGVFTFTTLDDAKKMAAFLDRDTTSTKKAVVIGGGLIGASVSAALMHRGVAVTMVEMKEKILNTILDEAGSTLAEEVFTRAGVQVLTAHTVARVPGRKDRAVSRVVLDDGRELPCDLVVVAIGVVPRTELVAGTPIAVNRGILVDRHLETSVPGVYACGDVAESFDFMWGARRLNPIWPKAYREGRGAGFNMAGRKTEYEGTAAMNSLNYFGFPIAAAGLVAPEGDGHQVLAQRQGRTYRKLVFKDGSVVGLIFMGKVESSGIIYGLMKDKVQVGDFKDALWQDDLGLIALPEELRRERLARAGGKG